MTKSHQNVVTNLNADLLDGLHESRFLRSDTSDTDSNGLLSVLSSVNTTSGASFDVDGALRMDGIVTKATTDRVTHLNADLLDDQ